MAKDEEEKLTKEKKKKTQTTNRLLPSPSFPSSTLYPTSPSTCLSQSNS